MKNFLIGLGVGIAAGTMLAPASGDQTRKQVRTRAEEILKRVQRRADRAWQRAGMRSVRGSHRPEHRERASRREERDGSATRLNSISREELLEVYGIGPVLADKIIQNRPYTRADEVMERGILPQSTFEKLREALGRRSA